MTPPSRLRAAGAGALAATVWALLEPLDGRLFRSSYSDVALVGKLVTRRRGWRAAGFTLHVANGAAFGLLYHELLRRTRAEPVRLAVGAAVVENAVLYPLAHLVDRRHPARGDPELPRLWSRGVFAQETFRHAVFGLVLGLVARKPPSRDGGTASERRP